MKKIEPDIYDVIIIGAGVIGCSIARELSKYLGHFLILEKETDVSCGASKANSGIVHGGFDDKHGSVKARMCRAGNRKFQQLEQELHFGYLECGSMVLGYDEEDLAKLQLLYENGLKNGLDDLQILDRDAILKREPFVNPKVKYALFCPTSGVTSPYELTIALCENALSNGVILKLEQEVLDIRKTLHFEVKTQNNTYKTRFIVNAAGLYSDRIAGMVGIQDFTIIPRKGEYLLLSKSQGHLAQGVLFQTPTKEGKGILVTRTYHGNLMLGPDAKEVASPEEVGTHIDRLHYIVTSARKTVKDFDLKYTLNSFAGIRATSSRHDFIIEESRVPGFILVAGIESPGLTSSPAIAEYVVNLLGGAGLTLNSNPQFNAHRQPIIVKKQVDFNGKVDDVNPENNIVCRCEKVTEAEIVDALHRGIRVDHIDGIKRRTRCTMGECQGNYCGPRVAKIIAREMNIPIENVTVRGKSSFPLPPRENRLVWKKLNEKS